jgi:hypothetical protein
MSLIFLRSTYIEWHWGPYLSLTQITSLLPSSIVNKTAYKLHAGGGGGVEGEKNYCFHSGCVLLELNYENIYEKTILNSYQRKALPLLNFFRFFWLDIRLEELITGKCSTPLRC